MQTRNEAKTNRRIEVQKVMDARGIARTQAEYIVDLRDGKMYSNVKEAKAKKS